MFLTHFVAIVLSLYQSCEDKSINTNYYTRRATEPEAEARPRVTLRRTFSRLCDLSCTAPVQPQHLQNKEQRLSG